MNSITSVTNLPIPAMPSAPTAPGAVGGSAFKDLLNGSLQQVNSMQQEANRVVENLMTGGDVDPAEVLTAVQKADMAFRMMMQVRNKIVAAYQEIKDIKI